MAPNGRLPRIMPAVALGVDMGDPFAYLDATLEAIAAGHPQSRIDDLTPWAYAAASSSDA